MFDVFYWGTKPNLFAFEQHAETLEQAKNKSRTPYFWYIYGGNDYTGFNFDWRCAPWEREHIHTFPSQWQKDGGVYFLSKTSSQYHFRTEQSVRRLHNATNWLVPTNIDPSFDFSWHPDPHEPDYEYHFGTQWQSAGGPVYPGTAGVKIVDTVRAKAVFDKTNWTVPANIDAERIDYSWHPNPLDPAYVYHFASQHQSASGVVYTVPGATTVKLADDIKVYACADKTNWLVPDYIDADSVDYTWHPNVLDPAYIYHFASQHQSASGVTYTVPGAVNIKLHDGIRVRARINKTPWTVPANIVGFDYSWHPDNTEKPYNYVFGNQHYPGTIMPTMMYCIEGTTQEKFIDAPVAQLSQSMANWEILETIDTKQWDWT